MDIYGGYEVTEELHRQGCTAIYRARKAGTSEPDNFIIVSYSTYFDKKENKERIQKSFLDAAQLQQQLAKKNPQHWMPIFEMGKKRDSVYYVSEFYPFTLRELIDRGLKVNSESLRHILETTIKGLLKIQELSQRPHGNLKIDNIWLNGKGKISKMGVLLSNPLSKAALAAMEKPSDFRALGELLYCLASRKETVSSTMRTVPKQEDWSFLGKKAASWKNLCNALLDPHGAYEGRGLEDLLKDIRKFKPKVTPPVAISASALLVVVMVGGYWYITRLSDIAAAERIPYRELWIQYATEYQEWLQKFSNQVYRKKNTGLWKEDKYLKKKIRDPLFARRKNLYPLDLIGITGDLVVYKQKPPEILKKKPRLRFKVQDAVEFLEQLKKDIREWPRYAELQDSVEFFKSNAWIGSTEEIAKLSPEPVFDPELFKSLIKANNSVKVANAARKRWETWLQEVALLKATNDPLLSRVENYLHTELAKVGDLEELVPVMNALRRRLDALIRIVQSGAFKKEIDFKRFQEESFVKNFQKTPVLTDFQLWLNTIKQYRYLRKDPRQTDKRQWEKRIKSIERDIAELSKVGAQTESDNYRIDLNKLKDKIVVFNEIPGIIKNRNLIQESIQKLLLGLDRLKSDVELTLIEKSPNIGEWLAEKQKETIPVSDEIKAVWTKRRDALLIGKSESDFPELTQFLELRQRFNNTKDFLVSLSGFLPLSTIPSQNIRANVQQVLEQENAKQRKMAMEQLLGLIPWKDNSPAIDINDFKAKTEVQAVKTTFTDFKEEAVQLGQALQETQNQLEEGLGLEAKPGQFWKDWKQNKLLTAISEDPAIKYIITQLTHLDEIAAETDPAQLTNKITNPETPLVEAKSAWLRLGSIRDGARNRTEIIQEVSAYDSLRTRLSGALRNQIQELAKKRWITSTRKVNTREDLTLLFEHMEKFGANREDLELGMQFNLFIYQELIRLEQLDFARSGKDQVTTVRDNLVGDLESRFSSLGAGVMDLIRQLKEVDPSEDTQDMDFTKVGPVSVGWSDQSYDDEEMLTFVWKRYRLEFFPLESADGDIYYLSKTELPVDLVIDWFNEKENWIQFAELMPEILKGYEGFDERIGPRVWIPDENPDNGITVPEQWLVPSPEWQGKLYPEGFNPGEVWQPGLPMQYLTPKLALYISQSLGCTLPPLKVWEAAVKTVAPNPPNASWNLRDLTWQNQKDYLERTNAQIQAIDTPWPDADTFGPESIPGIATGEEAIATSTTNDRFLWFAPVYTPVDTTKSSQFTHLIGNVSEYIYDEESEQYYVAGGSALSAPEIKPTEKYSVSLSEARNGYSDVGLRLAFRAPKVSPGRQIMKILKKHPFIFKQDSQNN